MRARAATSAPVVAEPVITEPVAPMPDPAVAPHAAEVAVEADPSPEAATSAVEDVVEQSGVLSGVEHLATGDSPVSDDGPIPEPEDGEAGLPSELAAEAALDEALNAPVEAPALVADGLDMDVQTDAGSGAASDVLSEVLPGADAADDTLLESSAGVSDATEQDTVTEAAPDPAADLAADPVAEHVMATAASLVEEVAADTTTETAVEDAPDADLAGSDELPDAESAADLAVEAAVEAGDMAVSSADAGPDAGTVPVIEAGTAAYAVDESVLAILREEAEREANARRADAQALETQTDLGLAAGSKKKKPVVAKVEAKPAARRDLLPDVEEINSTLRPSEPEADEDGAGASGALSLPVRRGFRSGFLAVMTVAILGAAFYITAPRIGAMVPPLAEPLQAYVTFIDSMRLHLDGMMRSATVAINGG